MERLIAIGDIHGCYKTLRILLEDKIKPTANDQLIFLGDYIDRGPGSKQVIDYMMDFSKKFPHSVFLRGNHEQTLLNAIENEKNLKKGWFSKPKNEIFQTWFEKFGGKETFDSYGISAIIDFPESHRQWLLETKHYFVTEAYYFVHAGFNFDEENILNDTEAMLWVREFDYDAKKAGNRKIVHGHVPVTLDFLKECLAKPTLGFVPLDTGCVYKERIGQAYLSAYDFSSSALFSVKNAE